MIVSLLNHKFVPAKIKNIMKNSLLILILILQLITGCGIQLKYYTQYSNDDISSGMTIEALIEKYGRPYAENLYYENGKKIEVLQYKEIMVYGERLNTFFYFEDGLLFKKTQEEVFPTETVVKERH